MNDSAIENEIQAKGLTAPRVTPDHIESTIVSEHYFTAAEGVIAHCNLNEGESIPEITTPLELLTFCVLILRNGLRKS